MESLLNKVSCGKLRGSFVGTFWFLVVGIGIGYFVEVVV